jgi:hypothetical protein
MFGTVRRRIRSWWLSVPSLEDEPTGLPTLWSASHSVSAVTYDRRLHAIGKDPHPNLDRLVAPDYPPQP